MIHSKIAPPPISAVVLALGTKDFENEALGFLNTAYGVEHYSVFRMKHGRSEFIGGASIHGEHAVRHLYGRHSTWSQSASDLHSARCVLKSGAGATIARSEPDTIADAGLRRALKHFHIVDRVMLCGRTGNDVYGLSLLRSDRAGRFEDTALAGLDRAADVLIAVFAKQTEIYWDRSSSLSGLESVERIEENLRSADWGVSERELQVSARILYGISALGIAHDLELREDTIATYRKRLYQRLQISSRHELLKKYLTLV